MPENCSNDISSAVSEVMLACEGVEFADDEAIKLEQSAQQLRDGARVNRTKAFSKAAHVLIETSRTDCSQIDIVTALARLNELDPGIPSLYEPDFGGKIIQAFKNLKPGEPIYNAFTCKMNPRPRVSGILTSEPFNLVVIHRDIPSQYESSDTQILAPWATVECGINELPAMIQGVESATLEVCSLHKAIVGHAALQAYLNSISFTRKQGGAYFYTNQQDLDSLRRYIDSIQAEIEGLDTSNLDMQLEIATGYQAIEPAGTPGFQGSRHKK